MYIENQTQPVLQSGGHQDRRSGNTFLQTKCTKEQKPDIHTREIKPTQTQTQLPAKNALLWAYLYVSSLNQMG